MAWLTMFRNITRGRRINRGAAFGLIIVTALLAFEIFNYSTTQFALADVLGDLKFAGLRWATILAIAFCGIDFAGIARIFTPQQGRDEPAEVWYLFGAWLLAAGFNATLTWWGVSVAIAGHTSAGAGAVISNQYIDQSRADLCSRDGLVDPCAHHWNILHRRRQSIFHCGCARLSDSKVILAAIPTRNGQPGWNDSASRIIPAAASPKLSPGAEARAADKL